MSFDDAAGEVLSLYPPLLSRGRRSTLGNGGGFSGARLWCVETPCGSFCLRAWPLRGPSGERLAGIHRRMIQARQMGLSFIPAVLAQADGSTVVEHAGRCWDLTDWMPGVADFHENPRTEKLEAACIALGLIHRAWAAPEVHAAPPPAIRRRLEVQDEWTRLRSSGWRPSAARVRDDPVQPQVGLALDLLDRHLPEVPRLLAPWVDRPLPLQPCLCDVWHDHILFEGDAVSGVIDFGSVKLDHVAVDLARLLGSLVADDAAAHAVSLRAYRRVGPLSEDEAGLAWALDRTGVLIGLANWLKWLYHDGRTFEDRHRVARRLGELTGRVEAWE